MSEALRPVPEHVELVYRVVGKTHVFSSKGLEGLVHVGSRLREDAFHRALDALNLHVSKVYGIESAYEFDVTCDAFFANVDKSSDVFANFVVLKRAVQLAA